MKWLKTTLLTSIAILVLISLLTYDEIKKLQRHKLRLHVNESDALYFRNMRQYFYSKEVRDDAGFDLFRLKKQVQTCSKDTCMHLMIVNNWMQDLAYLKAELLLNNDVENISFQIKTDSVLTFDVNTMNSEQTLLFGFDTYQSLFNEHAVYTLKVGDRVHEIWNTKQERDQIRTILTDYFKLTGAL